MTKSKAAPTAQSQIQPDALINLARFSKFPQAARNREIVKIVDKFCGNGVHLFVHFSTPILDARRKALLASGATRKKYHKTASQLWVTLDDDNKLFWDHQAKLIRLGIANGTLSYEQCIDDAGLKSEWTECLRFCERAVAEYLEIPLPRYLKEADEIEATQQQGEVAECCSKTPDAELIQHAVDSSQLPNLASSSSELLDTVRDLFTAEPRMIYGNFAQLYPYDVVRQAEGKHQAALLRQLADILDHSGKEYFYYFVTPHLWKSIRPTGVDQTITSIAHAIWMLMAGPLKKQWAMESARTKKLLGDGNVDGLDRLQLDGDCEEMWQLHELTEEAIRLHNEK